MVPVGDPGQGLSGQAQRSGGACHGHEYCMLHTVIPHPGGTCLWPQTTVQSVATKYNSGAEQEQS